MATSTRLSPFILLLTATLCSRGSAAAQASVSQDSVLEIPISVATKDLVAAIRNSTPSPFFTGNTGELRLKLLFQEEVTVTRLVQELVEPARQVTELITKRVPRRITKRIKEKPWLLLAPWVVVTETVFVEVKETVIKTIPARYRTVAKPFVQLVDKVAPTSAWVRTTATLDSFQLDFQGTHFQASALIGFKVQVDVQQKFLGARARIKGALHCTGQARIDLAGQPRLDSSGQLAVQLEKANARFTHLGFPGAVEAFDLATTLNPHLLAQQKLLSAALQEQLQALIQRSIEKQVGKLSLPTLAEKLAVELGKPWRLADSTWLSMNPREVFLTPILGSGRGAANTLNFSLGLVARPSLLIGDATPPAATFSYAGLSVRPGARPGFRVDLEARVNPWVAEKPLKQAVDEVFAENAPTFEAKSVAVTTKGSTLTFSVEVQDRSSAARSAKLVLTTTPVFDQSAQRLQLTKPLLELVSKDPVLNASFRLIKPKLERRLAGLLVLDIDPIIQRRLGALRSVDINRPGSLVTRVAGHLATVSVRTLEVRDGKLVVHLRASGMLRVSLDPSAGA